MAEIPGTRPLAQVIPNLARLLERPADCLAAGAIRIGPSRRNWILLILAAIPAAVTSAVALIEPQGWILAVPFVGAFLWLLVSDWPVNQQIVLQRDGLLFVFPKTSIWSPWTLFDAPGKPFLENPESRTGTMTLPISESARSLVEQRREGRVTAKGRAASSSQFRFHGDAEVVVPVRYAADPAELGNLLLALGRLLGGSAAATDSEPPKPTERPRDVRPFVLDANGWATVSLTQLALPATCCACGKPTDDLIPLKAYPPFGLLTLLRFAATQEAEKDFVALTIPMCARCNGRWQFRIFLGMMIGAAIGIGLAKLLGLNVDQQTLLFVFVAVATGVPLALLLDFPPVIGRFLRKERSVALWFRNREYTASLVKTPDNENG